MAKKPTLARSLYWQLMSVMWVAQLAADERWTYAAQKYTAKSAWVDIIPSLRDVHPGVR